MRLDFNVLWVDDQPARVEAQIRAIARDMENEGFQFNPTSCPSIEEVRRLISDHLFNDEIDLILVDWDLGAGVQGQQAIAEIRQQIQYKDVVFYSAQTIPATLRELVYRAGLEGVYCTDRTGLRDEVIGVFESLVKKVLDIDHTRGIVMGATSDIDHMVHECVVAIHGDLGDAEKEAMAVEALGMIESRVEELSAQVADLKKAPTMAALLKAHMVFTAADRLRMLSRALEKEAFKAHHGARKSVVTYLNDVVPKRNKLGHKVLLPDGKRVVAVVEGGEHVSLDEMRELRRLILTLRSDFRTLLEALQG